MLTAMDIEIKKFEKVKFGGYNTEEVNGFLDQVIVALEEAQSSNKQLKAEHEELNGQLEYYKTMEKALQKTLVTAEKTAQETIEEASKEAEKIILEGVLQADQLKQGIRALQEQYNSQKEQMKKMLQSQLDWLETHSLTVIELDQVEEEVATAIQEEEDYTKDYQIINEEDMIE